MQLVSCSMKVGRTLVTVGLLLAGSWSTAFAENAEQPEKRDLVATVLGEPVYLDQLAPAVEAVKREELGEAEFGRWLRKYRGRQLLHAIYGPLREAYAKQQGLMPTEEEIRKISERMDEAGKTFLQKQQKAGKFEIQNQTEFETRFRELQRQFAHAWVLEWKTCKALYEKYGGRVGIGSLGGCTPIEARKAFLQEQQKAGMFKIQNAALEQLFWDLVSDERFADAILIGEDIKEYFSHTPWESSPDEENKE